MLISALHLENHDARESFMYYAFRLFPKIISAVESFPLAQDELRRICAWNSFCIRTLLTSKDLTGKDEVEDQSNSDNGEDELDDLENQDEDEQDDEEIDLEEGADDVEGGFEDGLEEGEDDGDLEDEDVEGAMEPTVSYLNTFLTRKEEGGDRFFNMEDMETFVEEAEREDMLEELEKRGNISL